MNAHDSNIEKPRTPHVDGMPAHVLNLPPWPIQNGVLALSAHPRSPDDLEAYKKARERLAQEAANELAASVYVASPILIPEHHELRFCFPAPRVALYRNLLTGQDIVLRRDKNANTFFSIGSHGWEPFLTMTESHTFRKAVRR